MSERPSRLAQVAGGRDFSLAAAIGGPRGVVESVGPTLAFVLVFTLTGSLGTAVVVALGAALVAVVGRLVTRSPLGPALGGALGVGLAAAVAAVTGRAADFFSLGLATNALYAAVLLLSTVPWPRVGAWPVVGVLLASLTGGAAWRGDRRAMAAYRRLTWMWASLFVLRLAVQVPLYLRGDVAALGTAKLVMGVPLFAVAAWVTWRVVRRLPRAVAPPEDGDGDDEVRGAAA